jgi:hypothetical protein
MRINRAPTLGKPWHTIWVGRAKSPSALASVSKPVIVSVRLEFLSGADYRDDGESEVAPLFEAIEAVRPLIEKRAITRRFLSGRLRVWNEDHFHWAGTPPYGYRCVGGGRKLGRRERGECGGHGAALRRALFAVGQHHRQADSGCEGPSPSDGS